MNKFSFFVSKYKCHGGVPPRTRGLINTNVVVEQNRIMAFTPAQNSSTGQGWASPQVPPT